MIRFRDMKQSLLHLFFPHICAGCGSDRLVPSSTLCLRCLEALPATGFENLPGNPVEKIFWGRLPLEQASAQFYFTRESLVQRLMHQLKYKNRKDMGVQLGRLMGRQLKQSGRFTPDALVPLPLFPAKERKRGYNQAALLCEGMAEEMQIPMLDRVITRPHFTETQTKKGRVERWQNTEGKFLLADPLAVKGKHLLLVDDVVTTGATLESCGRAILLGEKVNLSIATFCFASR